MRATKYKHSIKNELIRGEYSSSNGTGTKPPKAELYLLAAQIQDAGESMSFKRAIYSAMLSYDYDYDYEYYYYYEYDYDYYYYYEYDYEYHNNSKEEKVITLLFLCAIYT